MCLVSVFPLTLTLHPVTQRELKCNTCTIIAFTQIFLICGEEPCQSEGSGRANCKNGWVWNIRAMIQDWYSHCTLPISGKCDMVTCRDPKEAQSSWAVMGMLMGQSACSSGGKPDLSTHKGEKPGDAKGLCFGTRANSSGCAVSSGSDAVSSLGAGTLTSGSALGVGDGALPSEVGATGSLLATSNISRLISSPLSITEVKHPQIYCIALQSIPRGVPEQTACLWRSMVNAIISLCHTTWWSQVPCKSFGEGNLCIPAPLVGKSSPQTISLDLCNW